MDPILEVGYKLLEAAKRPGLLGVAGKAIEIRCRKDLAEYFRALGQKIINAGLEKLVADDVLANHRVAGVEDKVKQLLRARTPELLAILRVNIDHAMTTGDRIVPAITEADKPEPGFTDEIGLSGLEAARYAELKAAELVKGINDQTLKLIQQAVAQGIETQAGVPGTARLIRQAVADMTKDRAEMIASTEMNGAMSEAALRKIERIGLPRKQVIPSLDACPICLMNVAQGAIPINAYFSSGDLRPPFHPNCRCAVTGALDPEVQESEDEPRDEQGRWTESGGNFRTSKVFSQPKVTLPDRYYEKGFSKGPGKNKEIELSSLHPIEDTVNAEQVNDLAKHGGGNDEGLPEVVVLNGKNVLVDGHHRAAAAIKRGDKYFLAKVYKI